MRTAGQVAQQVFGPVVVIYHSYAHHKEVTCVWANEDTRLEIDPQSGVEKEVRTATLQYVPVGGDDGLPEVPTVRAVIERDGVTWGIVNVMDKSDTHCTILAVRETELARSYRGRRL